MTWRQGVDILSFRRSQGSAAGVPRLWCSWIRPRARGLCRSFASGPRSSSRKSRFIAAQFEARLCRDGLWLGSGQACQRHGGARMADHIAASRSRYGWRGSRAANEVFAILAEDDGREHCARTAHIFYDQDATALRNGTSSAEGEALTRLVTSYRHSSAEETDRFGETDRMKKAALSRRPFSDSPRRSLSWQLSLRSAWLPCRTGKMTAILRGFISSGISRLRSMWSRPFFRPAPLHLRDEIGKMETAFESARSDTAVKRFGLFIGLLDRSFHQSP